MEQVFCEHGRITLASSEVPQGQNDLPNASVVPNSPLETAMENLTHMLKASSIGAGVDKSFFKMKFFTELNAPELKHMHLSMLIGLPSSHTCFADEVQNIAKNLVHLW